jgi:hypothetical protein
MNTWFYLFIICTVLFAFIFLGLVKERDIQLERVSDCIAEEAKIQDYQGNVYGKEAWSLFVSKCR